MSDSDEEPIGRGLKRGRGNDGDSSDDDDFDYGEGGRREGHGAIFVLENASLEVGKVGKTLQLLNCDDHANFLKKHRKDPADYRPDICHQVSLRSCSMQILLSSLTFFSSSSPLSKISCKRYRLSWLCLTPL